MTVPPTVNPPELSRMIGFLFADGAPAAAERGKRSRRIDNMSMAEVRSR
jgi:hypothetical protein